MVLEAEARSETEAQLDPDVPDGRLDLQFIDKTASILAAGMTPGGKTIPRDSRADREKTGWVPATDQVVLRT